MPHSKSSTTSSHFSKLLWGIWFILGCQSFCLAQTTDKDTLFLNGTLPEGYLSVIDYCRFYYNDFNQATFPHNIVFEKYNPDLALRHKSVTTWVRLNINNTHPKDTLRLVLWTGDIHLDDVFKKEYGVVNQANLQKSFFNNPNPISFSVLPRHTVTYWIRTSLSRHFSDFHPELYTESTFKRLLPQIDFNYSKRYIFIWMVIGLCFFLGIFAFVQYAYGKDLPYGFWASYLLVNSFFFFTELDRSFKLGILTNLKDDKRFLPWAIAVQFLVQITYLLFLNSFLSIEHHSKAIHRFLKGSLVIMLICFVFAVFAITHYDLHLTDYADMLLVFTNLLIAIIVFKTGFSAIPQTRLILIGTCGVLLAATIAVIREVLEIKEANDFWLSPLVSFGCGTIWELAFFSLALSERTRLIRQEHLALQKNYMARLEDELSLRINENELQNKQLEEQRIRQITDMFQQKIAEVEISALRSQMNPHFIFNCLNSIKSYALNNDTEHVSVYLTKFSRLIRLVLENSKSEKITLKNEIETLHLYLEMEKLRFSDKFDFIIQIDPLIEDDFIEIPPLLIQPFVENAIWHGLMQKENHGWVKIIISQPKDKSIRIVVEDDGIGRLKAAALKSKTSTNHKSFGMKITSQRLDIFKQLYNIDATISTHDLTNPTGTRVIIEIPT